MPRLSKQDPMYYRNEMKKLLETAKENGVQFYSIHDGEFVSFRSPITNEIMSCRIPKSEDWDHVCYGKPPF